MSVLGLLGVAGAGIGAAGALGSGAEQAGAANNAASLQAQEAANALGFQETEFNTEEGNQKPFLQAGTKAVNTLSGLTSTPGKGLLTPYGQTFQAPTAAQAAATPGEQFQLQQGSQAIDENAAATGNLLSGNTGTALENYGQGLAQTDYQNAYNNALQTYNTNFNVFNQNQANQYNRLAGLAGTGQTAAGQLGSEGQAAAQNAGNISLTTGAQQGQDMQNAAAAQASGYVGATNAVNSGIGNLSSLALYQQLLNPSTGVGNTNGPMGSDLIT